MKLYKKIVISGSMECLTGLHIGASKDSVQIGGLDLPVLRLKFGSRSNEPFIPGSSLKGKMRSLLQHAFGGNEINGDAFLAKPQTTHLTTAHLFGALDKKNADNTILYNGNSSALIVRDAYLTSDTASALKASLYTDMPYTELKTENSINRKSGQAEHPRPIERVPASAKFEVNFVINIFADTPEEAIEKETIFISLFNLAIKLLENDYLGGGGSRGNGQVKFELLSREDINIQQLFPDSTKNTKNNNEKTN